MVGKKISIIEDNPGVGDNLSDYGWTHFKWNGNPVFHKTVCFFLAAVHVLLAAITRLEFANSVFGTCREAGVVECECSNEEAERASENNQACKEGFSGCVHYFVSCNK